MKFEDVPTDESPSPILVTKCSITKRITADVLPCKGVGHPWCVQALVKVLLDAGHAKIILRSDDEAAIVALKERAIAVAKEQHKIDVIPVTTPHGDSQSNGLAEMAVRDVKGVARSLHYDMAKLHDVDIPKEHPILTWMVHFAGSVITRGQLGADGMTALQRWKGTRFKRA